MVTTASDGSIRIWDLHTFQQLLEFVVPGESCFCAQYHPNLPLIACGFGKGLVGTHARTAVFVQILVTLFVHVTLQIIM